MKEEIEALIKAGTTSAVLKKINAEMAKQPLPPSNQKISLTYNCASLESVTLKPIPVTAQLNQLKSYISKVSDKALHVKLDAFYDSVQQFSHMMSTLKPSLVDNRKCCELYQTTQRKFLNEIGSNKQKLQEVLPSIQTFESDLLQSFLQVPDAAYLVKVIVDNYASEMSAVMKQIDEIHSAKPKDKPKHTAKLNEIMDTFVRDDAEVIKILNDDVQKVVNEGCPEIVSFYDSLKQ